MSDIDKTEAIIALAKMLITPGDRDNPPELTGHRRFREALRHGVQGFTFRPETALECALEAKEKAEREAKEANDLAIQMTARLHVVADERNAARRDAKEEVVRRRPVLCRINELRGQVAAMREALEAMTKGAGIAVDCHCPICERARAACASDSGKIEADVIAAAVIHIREECMDVFPCTSRCTSWEDCTTEKVLRKAVERLLEHNKQ